LIEQKKTNKNLIEERKKLSRDFKLSQAANSDLERKRCLNWLKLSTNVRMKRRPLRLLRVRE
jgi:hypothetical protein